eukprot:3580565-Rhodomonas_salina.1
MDAHTRLWRWRLRWLGLCGGGCIQCNCIPDIPCIPCIPSLHPFPYIPCLPCICGPTLRLAAHPRAREMQAEPPLPSLRPALPSSACAAHQVAGRQGLRISAIAHAAADRA